MIVCLDGSSSMAGDKEIWSKAVALTLLEIARRQRRLFRFICFSSADTPLFTLDLNPRDHHLVREDRALDLAEYFPGRRHRLRDAARRRPRLPAPRRATAAATSSSSPTASAGVARMARALPAREEAARLLALLGADRRRPERARRRSRELSDRVTSVSTLTDDAARDLFLRI